jgi:uncharacterized small protein (DUF1192 family)
MRLLLPLLTLVACGDAPDTAAPTPIDAEAEAEARPRLQWWATCGDPVCRGWTRDTYPLCGGQAEGDPCGRVGAQCDIPRDACNVNYLCAARDPSTACPISQAAYKSEIRYLAAPEAEALHDELLGYKLASWRYTAEGSTGATHLGFVIDDVAPSAAVSEAGDTVDLYGYTSMTVAALQVQQRQIDTLQAEVAALRAELDRRDEGRGKAR